MSDRIDIRPRHMFSPTDLLAMHELRAKIFRDRLGWDVPVIDGFEIDDYDALQAYYLALRGPEGQIQGCARLLCTEGLYMLKSTFKELLYGQEPPRDPKAWELSRFAVETHANGVPGFAEPALAAMRALFSFATERHIERYLMVTTPALERLLLRTGLKPTRYGPPVRVGASDAVALTVDLGPATRRALYGSSVPAVA